MNKIYDLKLSNNHLYYLETAPSDIKTHIVNKSYTVDQTGMSDAFVFVFDDCVLKIRPYENSIKDEVLMLNFLKHKLPVPHIIYETTSDHIHYMLMSKIQGEMACSKHLKKDYKRLIALLAKGLKMLWEVPIVSCPISITQQERIQEGEKRYMNHDINERDIQHNYLALFDIQSIPQLIDWLKVHTFEDELVLSHGDYCLPNIFIHHDDISGFIDLGRSGAASKWYDIALCYRSLIDNFEGIYKDGSYRDFNGNELFDALGITPEWDKIWFYILLDELF